MRVALSIVVILSVFSTLAAENETKKEIPEEKVSEPNLEDGNSLEELTKDNDDPDVIRKKKSTTTTFCVEIRPSGPYQKPFQVCEPGEPAKPGEPAPAYSAPAPAPAPAPAYYSPPNNYAAQEQTKTQVSYQPTPSPAYKPASQPKPAPAYSSGAKTFSSSTSSSSSKSFSGHVPMSYSTYRSKAEESGGEETHDHMHMLRMTQASSEDDDANSAEMRSDHQMRTSGYGGSSYGSSSFGGPSSYIPVIPKSLKSKQNNHNGLVITCQPNLAGYAHNVPSSFHHPPSVPSYSYRSSTPRGYGYNRFQQQQMYGGGYQQAPIYKPGPPAYKPQPGVPKQQPPPMFSVATYQPAANPVYSPPMYKAPPAAYNPSPAQSQPAPPASPPSPSPMLFVSEITSSQGSASSDYGHSQTQHAGSISSGYSAPSSPPQLPPTSTYGQPSLPPPSAYAPAYASPAASSKPQHAGSMSAGYGAPPPPPPTSTYGQPPPATPLAYAPAYASSKPQHAVSISAAYAAPSTPPQLPPTSTYGQQSPPAPSAYAPAYASPAASSKPQHASSMSAGYGAPPPPPQLPPTSTYEQPPPPAPSAYAPAYASPAASSQPQQSYSSYSQSAPAIQEHSAASYAAGPAPASSGSSAYASAPSYSAPPAPSPNIPPQPPSYIPPGTYRESENEMEKKPNSNHKDEKEKHTLKKMEDISHQRAVDSHWETEMSTDKSISMKPEEHVGHPHLDWSMRSDNAEKMEDDSIAMKGHETNEVANNEIENSA